MSAEIREYFLPRIAGVTLLRDICSKVNNNFLPRIAGVTPVYLQGVQVCALLSSPHIGGYSVQKGRSVSVFFFLPRVAGVTPMCLRVDIKTKGLSSPHCGGYSPVAALLFAMEVLSSPRSGGYSEIIFVGYWIRCFLPRVAGVTL